MKNGLAIIIPSKTIENLWHCVDALRAAGESARVIVIDDFLPHEKDKVRVFARRWDNVDFVDGVKPFVFSRNMNLGIEAAQGADCILLNDDAMLKTPNGFSALTNAVEEYPEYGILGAVTNVTGQRLQTPRGVGLREVPGLAFVCVLIPRKTLDTVGLLDERFVTYGWEDNDYCHRVKLAGLKIGVHDNCYVDHGSLKSTFRGNPHAPGNIAAGREIFRQKWGFAP